MGSLFGLAHTVDYIKTTDTLLAHVRVRLPCSTRENSDLQRQKTTNFRSFDVYQSAVLL